MNILIISSLFFITNAFYARKKNYNLYSMFFIFLTLTSLICHSTEDNIYITITDKIAILSIVLYGFYLVLKKFSKDNIYIIVPIVITFLSTIYLHYYAKVKADLVTSRKYHFILHLLSSIGHNLIIYLP